MEKINKINKTIGIMMLVLMMFITSSFATGNVSANINSSVDVGYTPDNTIMYNFKLIGDWAKLNIAKFQGEKQYDKVENDVLQERLLELKVVSEKNKAKLQATIEKSIKERKDRKELKLKELKQKIDDRKKELLNNNVTSIHNDTTINDINKQVDDINSELKVDNNKIENKFKEVKNFRENELKQFQKKLENEQFKTKNYNKQLDRFKQQNPELFKKYGSLIGSFDGKTFKITTDKREITGEVKNGSISFNQLNNSADYNIKVKSEEKLKDTIDSGNISINDIQNNIDVPLSMKTKIAYNMATN